MIVAVAAVLLVFLAAEALRARRNEAVQRARGGVEPPDDVYGVMRIVYPAEFVVMLAEGLFRGGPPPPVLAAGAVLFAASKALKWWAIFSLGDAWTFRVIVVPSSRLVASGPYRLMKHPNYLAVVGELIGIAMMTGAIVTGPISVAVFGVILWKRMTVEDRALASRGTIRAG